MNSKPSEPKASEDGAELSDSSDATLIYEEGVFDSDGRTAADPLEATAGEEAPTAEGGPLQAGPDPKAEANELSDGTVVYEEGVFDTDGRSPIDPLERTAVDEDDRPPAEPDATPSASPT
ncbi:MAG: hypothetical protein JKY65_03265, partial [Planctomycetes bacterium]|nr:hypothetical protein [Planctomycetota bacterium]